MDDKKKPDTVTAAEFRAALEYIRAGEKKDDAAALAAERERLKLERERLALEREREKLRRERSRDTIRDTITEEPRKTVDPGGIIAAIISIAAAIAATITMWLSFGGRI